jgi:hypothetical protein
MCFGGNRHATSWPRGAPMEEISDLGVVWIDHDPSH